jgi:hypothetical protein
MKEKKNRVVKAVLATPTIHDVRHLLIKQYGDVEIDVLSQKGTISITDGGVRRLTDRIVAAVNKLEDGHYHLVLTGLPLANIIAFEVLARRFGDVSVLSFDVKRRRYVEVPNLPCLVDREMKKRKMEKEVM